MESETLVLLAGDLRCLADDTLKPTLTETDEFTRMLFTLRSEVESEERRPLSVVSGL